MKKSLVLLLSGFLIGCGNYCSHTPEVKYTRVNGFVNLSEEIFVNGKKEFYCETKMGNASLQSRRATLTQSEYCHLDELLHKANFFSLPQSYSSGHVIYDAPITIIEAKENEKQNKVLVEVMSHPPKELEEVIRYLVKLEQEKFGKNSTD